jgi:hypothetical protein
MVAPEPGVDSDFGHLYHRMRRQKYCEVPQPCRTRRGLRGVLRWMGCRRARPLGEKSETRTQHRTPRGGQKRGSQHSTARRFRARRDGTQPWSPPDEHIVLCRNRAKTYRNTLSIKNYALYVEGFAAALQSMQGESDQRVVLIGQARSGHKAVPA